MHFFVFFTLITLFCGAEVSAQCQGADRSRWELGAVSSCLPDQLRSPKLRSSLAALEGYKFCGSFASVGAIFDGTSK